MSPRRPIPTLGLVLALLAANPARGDEPAVGIADLESYRAALSTPPDPSAKSVTFRELWEHPEAHNGRSVKVEGRVARLFRQPRVGEFPPLVEAWIVVESGDPFCLVFPRSEGAPILDIGSRVAFTGTFLRKIRYQGADAARLAPLIVGPDSPSMATGQVELSSRSWSTIDWGMGVLAAGFVGMILFRRHFSRPLAPPMVLGPPPIFLDGGSDGEGDGHEVGD